MVGSSGSGRSSGSVRGSGCGSGGGGGGGTSSGVGGVGGGPPPPPRGGLRSRGALLVGARSPGAVVGLLVPAIVCCRRRGRRPQERRRPRWPHPRRGAARCGDAARPWRAGERVVGGAGRLRLRRPPLRPYPPTRSGSRHGHGRRGVPLAPQPRARRRAAAAVGREAAARAAPARCPTAPHTPTQGGSFGLKLGRKYDAPLQHGHGNCHCLEKAKLTAAPTNRLRAGARAFRHRGK